MLVVFSIVNDVSCEANENCLKKRFHSSKFCVLLISFNSSSFFMGAPQPRVQNLHGYIVCGTKISRWQSFPFL